MASTSPLQGEGTGSTPVFSTMIYRHLGNGRLYYLFASLNSFGGFTSRDVETAESRYLNDDDWRYQDFVQVDETTLG